MKSKVTTYFAHLLLSGLILLSADVPNDFEKLLENLEKQTFDYVQEKAYLHLDKPYYSKGDDLWFKAYTVAGPNHTPSPLSENLYVELIDPEGQMLKRLTVFLNKGLGKGDFELADSLAAGEYRLRAYTNWMRNFDEQFFFQRDFRIVDPFTDEVETATAKNQTSLRFFPEGGELIAGVPSQVALEWPGAKEGTDARIIDETGAAVVALKLSVDGLGKFGLLPAQGKQYFLTSANLSEPVPLPNARPNGFVMTVDNTSSDTEVTVTVRTANTTSRNLAYLVAHTRGQVGFGSKLDWQGSTARLKIPRKDLGDGLTHITLFNNDWQPEAERLIFQEQQTARLDFSIETDRYEYKQRDSTLVTIRLSDAAGKPLTGFFSMNVYDAAQISTEARKENISSYLLLNSDLNEALEKPLSLMAKDASSKAKLDLVLMTKGWTRFTWKDLLNDQFPETAHVVEQGFTVSGKVTTRGGKKGLSKATVKQVGAFEGIPLFTEVETDGQGDFEMPGMHFYEGESILKAKDKKGKSNVNLRLNELEKADFPAVQAAWKSNLEPIVISNTFTERSKERRQVDLAFDTTGVTDLGSVIVKADEGQQEFANMQRGLVFGRGEYFVDVSDKMSKGQQFVNALYTVQGIPGVNVVLDANSAEPVVRVNRKVFSFQNPDPPTQYYIDDAPVSLAAVTAMPAAVIERVEVLKGMRATAIFGPSANGGAILFYTKNKAEEEAYLKELSENNILLDKSTAGLKSGYYHSRIFYKPSYSGADRKNPKPDFRDLIHWEPMISTDENGVARVKFFNADLRTTVRIEVEGLWEGGIPLTGAVEYEVGN